MKLVETLVKRTPGWNWAIFAFTVFAAFVLGPGQLEAASVSVPDIGATPTSVKVVAGGGGSFGWINLDRSPLTLTEAFTDPDLLRGGYANAPVGTILEMSFSLGGLFNAPGPDLLLFEAFGADPYAISTGFDGFASEWGIPAAAFFDYGRDQAYYYQHNSVANPSSVFVAEIDLSSLGVPEGMAVTLIRLKTLGDKASHNENDPLGIAAVVPEPSAILFLSISLTAGALSRRRSNPLSTGLRAAL